MSFRFFVLAFFVALVAGFTQHGLTFADQPKEHVTSTIGINFTNVEVSYVRKAGGHTTAGTVLLGGNIQLTSNVASKDNAPTVNVSMLAVLISPSLGGGKDCKPKPVCCAIVNCVAVGLADERAVMLTPPAAGNGFSNTWSLDFRIIGDSALGPDVVITIPVITTFDASGHLMTASVDTGGCRSCQ